MNRVARIALLSLILAGCGGLGNRLGPDKLSLNDLPRDAAVIILSAGAEKPCTQFSTALHIYPAGAPFNITSVITSFNVDSSFVQSDFPTHHGSLSVLQLKPGSYYLVPVISNPNLRQVSTPKADISVAPGEFVYLGEYFIAVACGRETASTFRDQEARDLALLKQKNPAFGNVKITKRIASFTGTILGK